MVRIFILVKRKGSKKFLGAIPTKPGTSKAVLQKQARKRIRPGFDFRLVDSIQLKKLVMKIKPRRKRRKIIKRRKKK